MGLEILGLLAASAGASYGWWKLQTRRERRVFDVPRDPDLEVVLGVAQHEASTRGHAYLWSLHLLYGLAQDEEFVAALTKLGGDAEKFESYLQDELDKRKDPIDEEAQQEGARVVGFAFAASRAQGRPATTKDIWGRLVRTKTAKAAAAAGNFDAVALLFALVHGMREPSTELADRTDVHVVLRNDDHTTQEFVVALLREVFDQSEDDANTKMWQTHKEGRTIVGRYKLAVARDKVAAARRRAREADFPLWIGVEDC
ncbi:MAG TPA: ATP-dependent Clp protease adaptor ClpS [Kofleriaceae bacterium]